MSETSRREFLKGSALATAGMATGNLSDSGLLKTAKPVANRLRATIYSGGFPEVAGRPATAGGDGSQLGRSMAKRIGPA